MHNKENYLQTICIFEVRIICTYSIKKREYEKDIIFYKADYLVNAENEQFRC